MRKNETRLRQAERHAPPKFDQLTMVETIVAPNGPGGCDGDPIRLGIGEITRNRKNAPPIVISFDPPDETLLDADWDAMTDDDLLALEQRR
jgi:hypothetical protein